MTTKNLPMTALRAPAFIRKIGRAMRESVDNCAAWNNGHGKAYVANKRGNNVMRVSYFHGRGFVFYGDQARNITPRVIAALRQFGNIDDAAPF